MSDLALIKAHLHEIHTFDPKDLQRLKPRFQEKLDSSKSVTNKKIWMDALTECQKGLDAAA